MRWLLWILAFVTGGAALLAAVAAFSTGGTDIQLIGAGVFLTAFAICVGMVGVMVRLEQIRDRKL
jgi:hypothetical protein